ncbi:hypothetical protein CIW48_27195 [Methylobacterium sp. P1-11]|uniref:hypothetical protein n=1 Tax=Methylobacterium sp. P1-11 TaxID=2024616 RepID=UPI0011EC6217|nr:hypothetical protein [Methylobacterium sp. P1-11]KAA0117890.1 hypothetical protein CIW48_27195 [Methylobacterium sp. P1-11]
MAGGFVPFGQNLQLQGGAPLMKAVTVFVEKLGITKRLDGGPGLQGLMQKVLQDGNLSSVMQNPMAGLTQGIQGQLGGMVSQLQGMAGGGPAGLISALTGGSGLGNALGQLQASGDNLAGLTNGATGFFAMIGHANTADMAGAGLPAAAAMDVVTGPLTQGGFLGSVNTVLPQVVSQVVAGTMNPTDATNYVLGQIAMIGSITSGSAAALAYGEQMHPLISTVATVAGALAVPPTFDAAGYRQEGVATGFQGVLASIVQPDPAATMAASVAAQIDHVVPPPVDVAAMTSLD